MYGGVSTPPFRAAISEYPWWQSYVQSSDLCSSQALTIPSYHNNTFLESQYHLLLSASACTNLQCLRSLDPASLKAAAQQTYVDAYHSSSPPLYAFGDFFYGPSVDGDIIRDLPSNEWKQGHFTKVPLLVDHNGYEGYNYGNQSITTASDAQADLQTLWPAATTSFFDRLYQLYPREAYNSTFWQRQTLFGDYIINCPTYYMASAMADAGLPAYKLVFNAGTQLHGATSPFLFNPNDSESKFSPPSKEPTPNFIAPRPIATSFPKLAKLTNACPAAVNNSTLAAYMKDWFISFVTDLDPNARSFSPESEAKPFWPLYNPRLGTAVDGAREDHEFAIMDVNYTQVGVIPDFDVSDKCDFWFGRSFVVRN
jgi:carboxylesterase type B